MLAAVLLLAGGQAMAWTTVGTGIEYEKFVLTDPNNVYVARMLRSSTTATMESSLPQGKLTGLRETVRGQATRYDESINYWGRNWGQRSDVVVAVNGDWIYLNTGLLYGGQVHSGWYAKEIYCEFGGSQFAWTLNRVPFIGACLHNTSQILTVRYIASGQPQTAQGLNCARGSDSLIIYTPQYDNTTRTDNSGVEVLVEMTTPAMLTSTTGMTRGYVREIRQGQGSTPIPFDHIVLSATGAEAVTLLGNVSIGSEIGISLGVTAYEYPGCKTPLTFNWADTYASVSGGHILVHNGVVRDNSGDSVMASRHPRTAVAYNATYVYLIVCDGRSTASRGMTGLELGNFCKNTLGATYALNLDGGGSSTMVVNGAVVNVPSDGSERAIGNCLMMVNVLPKAQSSAYTAGQYVSTTGSANVRLGPGTNYGVITTAGSGSVGTIVDHSLKGVQAKGYNWWKVAFSGVTGWVAGSLLAAHGTALPVITAHPSPQTRCIDGTVKFTVSAVGSGNLSYQWQRGGVNLAEGGRYSGTAAPTLSISGLETGDAGSYRCVVSSIYGATASVAAALTVLPGMSISIGPPSAPYTKSGPVTYTITYTGADSISLSATNVTQSKTGSVSAILSVSGSGNTARTVTLSGISGNGTIAIYIASGTASGCGSAPAVGPSTAFIVDNTTPSAVVVTDEGSWTPSLNTLRASWTAASDSGSGIAGYQYAIGTSLGLMNIRPWTDCSATMVVADSLTLSENLTYHFAVRAVDRVGIVGPTRWSDGITVAPGIGSIGSAWGLQNSVPLSLRGKMVTCAQNGAFWLQEHDRTAGIKVVSPAPVSAGNTVSVAGVLGMSGVHRALLGDVVESSGGAALAAPVGMPIRGLGGGPASAMTPGVSGGSSLYNIGLLVRCWGVVTHVDVSDPAGRFFYLDDGSGIPGGAGRRGVLVRCGSVAPPASGMVAVTGVVSSELVDGAVVPVILTRGAGDIETLGE